MDPARLALVRALVMLRVSRAQLSNGGMGSAEPRSTEGLLCSHLVQEEETKKPLSDLPSLCSSSFGSVLTQMKGSCPAEHAPQSLLEDRSGEYVCVAVGWAGAPKGTVSRASCDLRF